MRNVMLCRVVGLEPRYGGSLVGNEYPVTEVALANTKARIR